MTEELDTPVEKTQEVIQESLAEASREKWFSSVALSSALLAVLAAITALLSGNHANEAALDQIQASDQWGFFQAKSIKASVLNAKIEVLAALQSVPAQAGKSKSSHETGLVRDLEKAAEYRREQDEISAKAKEKEAASSKHLHLHLIFARGVTMFQVAIGIAAISVLTRRRYYWLLGLGFGVVGVIFLLQGIITS